MTQSRSYWISTACDGYPHSRPVWGVWRESRLYFSTGSAIAKNITRDPRVQINLESADELVIVEGNAGPISENDVDFWVTTYKDKYNWDMPRSTNGVFRVTPVRVLAWICDPSGLDGGTLFSNTATEWRFEAGG
ncbi:MAG: pyridoxamine 5'-phosphate oxidase family protein [Pseudomonadales bacterium]